MFQKSLDISLKRVFETEFVEKKLDVQAVIHAYEFGLPLSISTDFTFFEWCEKTFASICDAICAAASVICCFSCSILWVSIRTPTV